MADELATRFRPTVVEIDLAAVRHNVRALTPPGVDVMAVVKADGYGHGDVPVARAAVEAGASWLGVALVEEGLRLRAAGLVEPILVLTQFPPGSERDALRAGLTPTLYSEAGLDGLAAAVGRGAAARGRPAVHVKVDTGMHRVGLPPRDAVGFVRRVADAGFEVDGLWTHLAVSEVLDDPATLTQLDAFAAVLGALGAAGFGRPRLVHAAATAGAIAWPAAMFDLVRVGIGLYGISPGRDLDGRADIRPAMTWRSAVSFAKRLQAGERISYGLRHRLERDAWIATVPVGYADGFRRQLSGSGEVLIRGRRRPVAGTVTMDQIMVDCGDGPVEEGDEVVLVGRQGGEEITAAELATRTGTIPYEVVCAVSGRVPRIYVGG